MNLACLLAKQGLSVLLWDLDPQGGSSYFFDLENKNDNTHFKLFNRYITIYDVIQSTDNYQIDVISNDSKFSDQFLNKASPITTLNFINHDLIDITLNEVKDDYDVCVLDCSPGRFLLHENIFKAVNLILIPNTPTPLSVYCTGLFMQEINTNIKTKNKVHCFFNMVEVKKSLHRNYLNAKNYTYNNILKNYIPFYSDIEAINYNKTSIFHDLKESKSNIYYWKLWMEICDKLHWDSLKNSVLLLNIQEKLNVSEEFENKDYGEQIPDKNYKTG